MVVKYFNSLGEIHAQSWIISYAATIKLYILKCDDYIFYNHLFPEDIDLRAKFWSNNIAKILKES